MALAAGAVYFFDPVSGRRRRVLLRDQCSRAARTVNRETRDVREELSHRMHDFAEGARMRFANPTSDKALGKHLRHALQRAVSHPETIGVKVRDGIVFLRGDIYSHEHQRLLDEIRNIPGLHVVTDHLVLREAAEGLRRLSSDSGKAGDGWSVAGRLFAGATGCALLFWGVRERKALGEFGTSVGQKIRRASKVGLDEAKDAIDRGIDAAEQAAHEGELHGRKWHGEQTSSEPRVAI
jgi:hypothetical protein